MHTRNLGKLGEKYIEKFLTAKNYQIIKTNYHARFGEIDIIAIDREDLNSTQLVFIEVKTRKSLEFGGPSESITYQKKQRLIKTALHFLHSNPKFSHYIWRMDLIGLELEQDNSLKNIVHLKNILNG